MRLTMLLLLTLPTVLPLGAAEFFNLTPEAHLAGPSVETKATEGRVILVADFGFRCPRCRACLPKLADLAERLATDRRFLMLGAHVQQRDESAVRTMLRETGAEGLPVYQFLRAEGAPTSQALPFAYLLDHTGETVWAGDPGSEPEALEKAVRDALKRVPPRIPGSLISGVEVLYNKEMPRLLVAGRNIERHLKTLRLRGRKDTPQGREAKALAELCEIWAEERCAAIDADLEAFPSRALAAMKELNATMPSVSGRYKELYRALMQNRKTAALAAIRQAAERPEIRTGDPRRRQATAKMLLHRLQSAVPEGTEDSDAADVKALIEALAE